MVFKVFVFIFLPIFRISLGQNQCLIPQYNNAKSVPHSFQALMNFEMHFRTDAKKTIPALKTQGSPTKIVREDSHCGLLENSADDLSESDENEEELTGAGLDTSTVCCAMDVLGKVRVSKGHLKPLNEKPFTGGDYEY